MTVKFVPIDRDTPDLFPPSVQDYLPEDHLARFIVDIVEQLNVNRLVQSYSGKGSSPYHPAMMLALLFYGYATGTFSSRKLEKATYDSVSYRFICVNTHPDHDSINTFRKRFMKELEELFVEILIIAQEMGVLKMGTISLDGTKIKANASKHKALSWKHAQEIEKLLQEEVVELMRLADQADNSELPDGLDIPAELERREARLAAISEAKQEIKIRAQHRYDKEQVEYVDKLAKRVEYEETTGKKPSGKAPTPPQPGPRDKDQVNLTDAESRIMPSSGGGFEQCYNAQASVEIESGLIITNHITQNTNDKLEIKPTLEQLNDQKEALGTVDNLLADAGYLSEDNVKACCEQEIKPSISTHREKHHIPFQQRFNISDEKEERAVSENPVEEMKHRMRTKTGRALYAKRKSTIEPTFGVIKQVLGFRQFLLRGFNSVQGEWNLVCIGYNLKKLFTLMR